MLVLYDGEHGRAQDIAETISSQAEKDWQCLSIQQWMQNHDDNVPLTFIIIS